MKQGAPVYHEAGKPAPDEPAEKPAGVSGLRRAADVRPRCVASRVCQRGGGSRGAARSINRRPGSSLQSGKLIS